MSDETPSVFAAPGSMGAFPSDGIVKPEVLEPEDEQAEDEQPHDMDDEDVDR